MFKINKKIEYALMVLKHLQSHPTTLATARQVCEIYNCPFDSTSKVMQIMASHNILTSVQGVKGGYRLTADLNSLSYLYLAQIIEGKSFEHNCTELDCSLIESCNITAPVSRLNDYLTDFFQTITIRDLLEDRLTPLEIIQQHESVL